MNPLARLAFRFGARRIREHHVEAWRDEQDVEMLALAVADRRSRIRRAAVGALGAVGSPEAIAPLRLAMCDRVKSVALAAASELLSVDDSAAPDVAAVEAYWAARARRKLEAPEPVEGKLIERENLVRFEEFKRKVLAQAGRGQFYG